MCAAALVGHGEPAQAPATSQPKSDAYRNEALVFERYDTTYRMHADGTGERDSHVVMRVQSSGAAQKFGVLAFSYASAYETPKIQYVRVHKADGTTVETPTSEAMDMSAEVSRQAPLYSDLKEKHIPVRSLAAGDTLEYEVDTTINRPEVPDQFWGATHFTMPGTLVVLAETLTLEFPADKYVQVWSPNHEPEIKEGNGLRVYKWTVPQLIPAPRQSGEDGPKPTPPKDPDEDSQGRKIPSVAWTTFHSWAEVGEWYRGLAYPQSRPTDVIRERANEITAKATTPEGQIRAIYEFVSTQTRYVGIDFGMGRYRPHAAQEVLTNSYGDCKDKDTLLEALLAAKGFSTAPALIGAGIAPVPEVPSPAVFNHVITTVNLPSGQIWLDSTPNGAPYRYLSAIIRDQKTLVVPPSAPASLQSTPEAAPYPFTARFEAVGTLDKDGKMSAKVTAAYRDDDELVMRALARTVAPAERDQAAQYISAATGFGGTTSNTEFRNADDTSKPMIMSYDYSRHPFGDWDSMRIVPLFPALEFTALDSKDTAPSDDIDLGAPRTLNAISRIKLPEGYRTNLPDPIHVKTPFATFDKTYHFDNGEIVSERTVVVLKKKVDKGAWKAYQAFTKNISLSGEPWIQLLPPAKPITIVSSDAAGSGKPGPKPDSKSDLVTTVAAESSGGPGKAGLGSLGVKSPLELMTEMSEKLRVYDWASAREILDAVKAKNPKQTGLWACYGYIAEAADHDDHTAIEDYRKEVEISPDNKLNVSHLADLLSRDNKRDAARKLLQNFFQAHPEDAQMAMYLGNFQTQDKDYQGALKTYEAAAEQSPEDRQLRLQVAETLVRLHRYDEASAAAKSALDGVDDPDILNSAAYTLSEAGRDLNVAEEAARKAIAKLEERSATITTDQVNQGAYSSAYLLIASWDTLGWILFQEEKYEEAKAWLSPAWRASLLAEVGSHLGQTYERLGKKEEAASGFRLAKIAVNKNTPANVVEEIDAGVARLHAGSASSPIPVVAAAKGAEELQNLRSYKVKRPAGASGWGTFRLEVTTSGVIEAQQVSGEQKLSGTIKPALMAMKFSELLPAESKAHLLRSAVVSCSMGNSCDVVLVPDANLQTEQP
jgi:tetratricopeptide (TPR) repeat protein/transglutaminase-like putative cysteine protease